MTTVTEWPFADRSRRELNSVKKMFPTRDICTRLLVLRKAARLAEGRSIGSGQIEGACKNLIGRRLKQTGARWKVRRVNRLAGLCSIMYSDLRKTCWNAA